MNEDNINFNGEPPKVLDTYSRHNPMPQHVGKKVWFTIPGIKEIFIGKIVGMLPLGYAIETKIAGSPTLRPLFINSQLVIVPE